MEIMKSGKIAPHVMNINEIAGRLGFDCWRSNTSSQASTVTLAAHCGDRTARNSDSDMEKIVIHAYRGRFQRGAFNDAIERMAYIAMARG